MRFCPWSKSIFAIDIQSEAIYILGLRKMQHTWQLCFAHKETLSRQVAGQIPAAEQLQNILSTLIRNYRLRRQVTILPIPAGAVYLHECKVPIGFPLANIREKIKQHLAQVVPELNEAVAIDYIINQENHSAYHTIAYAAVKASYLQGYLNWVMAAGLKQFIIDIDIYALVRIIKRSKNYVSFAAALCFALCWCHQVVYILLFSANKIYFYHVSVVASQEQLYALLQLKINAWAAVAPSLKKLLVYCSPNQQISVKAVADLLNINCIFANPWESLIPVNDKIKNIISHEEMNFLLAAGLALREVRDA